MRNKYPGRCADGCGTHVAEGEGYFEKVSGTTRKWVVRCMACVVRGKLARGVKVEHLSRAQQKAWRNGVDLG